MTAAARLSLDSPAAMLTVGDLIALLDAQEIWRPLPGFPYEVSSHGRVRRSNTQRVLRPGLNHDGYLLVCLCKNARKTSARVNRLVAMVFLGSPPFDGAEALHGDGHKANNRVSNIRWGTTIENQADQDRHGTRSRGSNRPAAKLTEADIPKIDRMMANGGSYRKVGARMGVCPAAAYYAHTRQLWKHVPREGVAA